MMTRIDGTLEIALNGRPVGCLTATDKEIVMNFDSLGGVFEARRSLKTNKRLQRIFNRLSHGFSREYIVGEIQIREKPIIRVGHGVRANWILSVLGYARMEFRPMNILYSYFPN